VETRGGHDQERELVERSRRGDTAATDLLIRETMPMALRIIGTHLRHREDAADVLLSIWRSIRNLEDPEAYRLWVYRIIRHRVTDHLRRRYGDEVEVRTRLDENLDAFPAREEGAELRSDLYQQVSRRIEEGIARQGEGYQQVLRLHLLRGRTYQEIANETGQAIGTVKSQISRGRKRLLADLVRVE
jgi:RNA polymerase sigma-70 factor (ECF subfamily)